MILNCINVFAIFFYIYTIKKKLLKYTREMSQCHSYKSNVIIFTLKNILKILLNIKIEDNFILLILVFKLKKLLIFCLFKYLKKLMFTLILIL